MTDKEQIIIDGVDVSKCDYFYNKECRCLCDCMDLQKGEPIAQLFVRKIKAEYKYCEQNSICYFKELEHKKKQCEEYMTLAKQHCADYFEEKQKFERKEQENNQLKAENETYKKMLDNSEVRVALIDVQTGEREIWRKLGRKAQTYKQALDEIEEVCKNQKKDYNKWNRLSIDYWIPENCVREFRDKILDIINKAKEQ